jgi:uncharacterized protein (TIGR00251 family)
VTLAVRVTARASRSEVTGIQLQADGRVALAVRVASPPVDGAANDALIAWLAKRLGVARGAIAVRSGATGRLKILQIEGDGVATSEKLAILAAR